MRTMMGEYYSKLVVFYYITYFLSITKAAKHLDCSKAHVSKQLSSLERTVGSPLFTRNTRTLKLTFAGEVLFKHAQSIVSELQSTENTIRALQHNVGGTLRITSPQGYADYVLSAHIPRFLAQHPDVTLEMVHTGAYVNLVEENIDVAIRITHEPPLDRVAKLLGYDHMVLCASKKYLEQYGEPKTPKHLHEHDCLVYSPEKSRNHWPFYDKNGLITISVQPKISSNSIRMLLAVITSGMGIARLPQFAIQESISDGSVQTVLADFNPPGTPIYAIYAQSRIISPNVGAFVTFLAGIHSK